MQHTDIYEALQRCIPLPVILFHHIFLFLCICCVKRPQLTGATTSEKYRGLCKRQAPTPMDGSMLREQIDCVTYAECQ